MKADWIDSCVDAAKRVAGDADQVVAERLKAELKSDLSVRGFRPKELGDLADQLISLSPVVSIASDTDSADADQNDIS
jgi:hypothetical protein